MRLLKPPRIDWKPFLITSGVDLAAWLATAFIVVFAANYLLSSVLNIPLPDSIAQVPESQLTELTEQAQGLFTKLIFIPLAASLALVLILSAAKSFIWAKLAKTPFTTKLFLRALLLGLIFLVIAALGTALALIIEPAYQHSFFMLFLLVFTYLGFYGFLHVAATGKIKGWFTGAFKRWDLFLTHAIIFAVLLLFQQPLNTLKLGVQALALGGMFALIGYARFFLLQLYEKRGG